MYADDAVIFTHGKDTQEASSILKKILTRIQEYQTISCLLLNIKTVCMVSTKSWMS